MAKTQAVHDQCPIEVGLNILSGKWKLKILWHLSKGTIRFNELQRKMMDRNRADKLVGLFHILSAHFILCFHVSMVCLSPIT